MAHSLRFIPSARLQKFLGTELIADPNVAIIEFVKNSYDAGASRVLIEFSLLDEPSRLVIADDGVGMDLEAFQENWMHPGFSNKADEAQVSRGRASTAAERRRASREPVGEKGIGRLAAGRLGARLEVFSRERSGDDWLHVDFVWSRFDDMNKRLDEVAIPYDFTTAPPITVGNTGTIVVIHELTQRWEQGIRGRVVRGRRTTRLGRLKQDLQYLVRPLTPTQNDFRITLESDVVREREDVGAITPEVAIEDAHYSYEFVFTSDSAGRPRITRRLRRNAEAARLAARMRSDPEAITIVTPAIAKQEGRPSDLSCGPFRGVFLYNPPAEAKRAREIDKSDVGVLLYRDGLLVEPYGMDNDDWVGVRARKAQRHGHAAITPDTFSGYVLITRRHNPRLRDMSNRLGLLDTPESESFLEHVRAEFLHFERLLRAELIEPRVVEHRAGEAQSQAERAQRLSGLRLRGLAHSLRQPLQGMGYELVTLRALEDRSDIPEDARGVLRDVREAIASHLARAEAHVRRFLDVKELAFASVAATAILDEALGALRPVAQSAGVILISPETTSSIDVLVPPEIVVQALGNIIENAIEAPRRNGVEPTITVAADVINGDVRIEVKDNGSGIPGFRDGMALRDVRSTKGRPEVGLADAEVALAAANGSLRLIETGPEGTTFEVWLPSRLSGLKH